MSILDGKRANQAVIKYFSYPEGTDPEYIRKDRRRKEKIALSLIATVIFVPGLAILASVLTQI